MIFTYIGLPYFLIIILFTIDDLIFSKKSTKKRFSSIFSLYTNGKNLVNMKLPKNSISCIHGLKTLSMIMIVFYHSYQILFLSTILHVYTDHKYFKHVAYWMTILATDTFFVISGLLSVECFMRKDLAPFEYLRILFQRYMRLMPTAAFFMIILLSFENINWIYDVCRNYWWSSMLLIQSYYNPGKTCITPLWFVAVCWHVFLITPIILKLLKFSNRLVRLSVIITILALTFLPGYMYSLGSKAVLERYTDTITRSYPYLFGVFYYHEFFKIKEVPKPLKVILWITTMIILLSPALHLEKTLDNLSDEFHLIRILWPLSICWLIHACHNGWGGIINTFLSSKPFIPFSNICLGLYIVNDYVGHFVRYLWQDQIDGNKPWIEKIITMFVFTYVLATVIAMVLYLCVEVPFFKLGKLIADSSCFATFTKKFAFLNRVQYANYSKNSTDA